ncbi:hypothetical protein BC831DRAFT_481172 [Entophlyctis helioformis]|nr:hypothetical protein BC831DRAFT_481172 [Entophlyctis helioformis]
MTMMAKTLTITVLHALCLLTRTIQSRAAMQAVRQRPTSSWTSWPVRQYQLHRTGSQCRCISGRSMDAVGH